MTKRVGRRWYDKYFTFRGWRTDNGFSRVQEERSRIHVWQLRWINEARNRLWAGKSRRIGDRQSIGISYVMPQRPSHRKLWFVFYVLCWFRRRHDIPPVNDLFFYRCRCGLLIEKKRNV